MERYYYVYVKKKKASRKNIQNVFNKMLGDVVEILIYSEIIYSGVTDRIWSYK